MNIQSNTYTYIYSTIIVLIVAAGLAVVSTALKPSQVRNVEVEKKQNILTAIRVTSDVKNAEALYKQYIVDSYTLNTKGEKVAGIDPFEINLREEMKKSAAERHLPAFEARKNDSTYLIIPLYGKGLWGPIWGYVSFKKDEQPGSGMPHFNTIYGVMFDHKGETPGLGAEISQPFFQHRFYGKKVFDENGKFVSVAVLKGGADPASLFEVDGISGGTITSKATQDMLDSCLRSYQTYSKMKN